MLRRWASAEHVAGCELLLQAERRQYRSALAQIAKSKGGLTVLWGQCGALLPQPRQCDRRRAGTLANA